MLFFPFSSIASFAISLGASMIVSCSGHGLMEYPPSRNMYCGVITKPDEIQWGSPAYPECGAAFAFSSFSEAGYQFMSVLTHDKGRASVIPLPSYVCSSDSESWGGAATPWDAYGPDMDWPATQMTSGINEFKWLISWGSHFDDTEEFRYWITKSDFSFDPSRPLTWDDFETEAFCVLEYNDANPSANPDVIPLKDTAQFRTFCDVPERSGRHIIYGEWGRNEYTYERFHGCVDVQFDGTTATSSPLAADISLSPSNDPFIGSGSITLDGSASVGDNLAYSWAVSTIGDDALYTVDDPNAAVTTLSLAEPSASQKVMISLLVSNADGSASTGIEFLHTPFFLGSWSDLGLLTRAPLTLAVGTKVSVRAIDSSGTDAYYPSTPLVLDNSNVDSTNWPVALSQAISSSDPVAVGVLDTSTDEVKPEYSSSSNRIYARTDAGDDIVNAYLQVEEPMTSTTSTTTVTPPMSGDCAIEFQDGANPHWAGLLVGFETSTATLDFSNTGLDLNDVSIQQGVFVAMEVSGQTITLSKPSWVSMSSKGYMGFNGNGVDALATMTEPSCVTGN